MFQDIAPHQLQLDFVHKDPSDNDYVILINKDTVLMDERTGTPALVTCQTARTEFPAALQSPIYLFSMDDISFFLSLETVPEKDGFGYHPIFVFRDYQPPALAFAGATALHLALWYGAHRFCGRCATPFTYKAEERAVICPGCGHVEYPRISPVVIVGITNGNRLLLTKYAAGYARYALVAGFVEVGETLEDAVRREVMEEVGLKVKNIRYYKSQPWAFSGSLLSGFFAEVDGDDTVTVDQKELSEASWFEREAIPPDGNTMSLTWTMVEAFKSGDIK